MKTIIRIFQLFIFSSWFFGCNRSPKVEYIEVKAIPVMEIFVQHHVLDFLNKHGNKYENQADWYVKQGLMMKEENPTKAIWNIKRAITLYPCGNNYTALVSILKNRQNYMQLADVVRFIQKMSEDEIGRGHGFKSLNKEELLNYVVYYFQGYGAYPYDITQIIDANGFSYTEVREALATFKPLQPYINTPEFKSFNSGLYTEEEIKEMNKGPEVFQNLLRKFKPVNEISETRYSIPYFEYTSVMELEYEENIMEYNSYYLFKERAAPDFWCRIQTKSSILLADSNYLLHYVVDTSMLGVPIEKRQLYHVFATFNKLGKPIDYLIVGKQSPEQLVTFTCKELMITTETYKRVWKYGNDYLRNDNEVEKIYPLENKRYQISEKATFVPL